MTDAPSVGSGRVYAGSDFTGGFTDGAWAATGIFGIGGGLSITSVNEGSLAQTVDESGGILAITTDTADNDNAAIFAHGGAPRDGKMVVRGRWKINNLDTSVYFGFAETLDAVTPVMPAEFATATMTYNGTGGMVGLQYDVDGTTDDYRALMGDGGAAISDSSNGIRSNMTTTVDRYIEGEVILNEDGSAECWLGDVGHQNSDSTQNRLRLIKRFFAGTLLDPTNVFFAVLMAENRSGNARVLEVDYFYAEFGRDWRAA